jgi:hypothetical protein
MHAWAAADTARLHLIPEVECQIGYVCDVTMYMVNPHSFVKGSSLPASLRCFHRVSMKTIIILYRNYNLSALKMKSPLNLLFVFEARKWQKDFQSFIRTVHLKKVLINDFFVLEAPFLK